jgi:UDP-GlcNAc:undecaprenyl-phosphate/decaprenyl-phosphate GlcNAc-1-phosphate transferase
MGPLYQVVLAAISGFALSLALVPLCRRAALRFGFTAKPQKDRWHRTPTALLGGVGIAVSVFGAHLWIGSWQASATLLTATFMIFVVGLVDDLGDLKPQTKLVAEIAIASALVFQGYRLEWVTSLTLDTLLTIAWLVGFTNAFNLLDNMDGLCAGTALIAGSALLATQLLAAGATPDALHLALLLGATAGFLYYNFSPASIFMGDSGSLFIGLNLAILTLGSQRDRTAPGVLSIVVGPLLMLLIPIFDTVLVTASRVFSGRSAAQGGRDHSSHRLVAMGLSERSAVAVLWALAALGGLLALAISRFQNDWFSVAAAVFVLLMIILAVYLAHVRVYGDADERLLSSGRVTPVVATFLYKRRVAEVLLDFCLASIAYYAAYRLRFDRDEFGAVFPTFLRSLPAVVGVQIVSLFLVGGYRGVWRYFGLMDGVTFARAVALGTVSAAILVVLGYGIEISRSSVFAIYAALLMLALITSRASFRLIGEFAHRTRQVGQRLIIYGAGDGAATAVRDLLSRSRDGYRMVGFIDDDPLMARAQMLGYPVLGDFASLTSLVANDAVDIIVVTTNLISVDRLEHLAALCAQHGVSLSRLRVWLDEIVAS